MNKLEGYNDYGILPALLPLVGPAAVAAGYGIYKLVKPNEQNTGTKYIPSGRSIKTRTRVPPDGRLSWITPEDMDSIVITIVDGADTVLRKIQVFSAKALKKTAMGAPTNIETWDKRFIGWKGSGKGKWFRARPDLVDFYYYVDGDPKQEPYDEQQSVSLAQQTQSAADISVQATGQGNLNLAQEYERLSRELAQQTGESAEKAGTDSAKQAAETAILAAQKAQATLEETLRMLEGKKTDGMPSWVWIAIAGAALFLLMKR